MRRIVRVIVFLLCVNCISFTIARVVFRLDSGMGADLVRGVREPDSDEMTYLIAGNLNQPLSAFQFLESELPGNITYVQFQMTGWSARCVAEEIANEVLANDFSRVNVYAISLGDHVSRYLEDSLGDCCELHIVAINPCSDISFVREPFSTLLRVFSGPFEILCHGLGWFSVIPFIPAQDGTSKYSMILLADQYWSIAYDRPSPSVSHTIGVVCSQPGEIDNDGFLENTKIRDYFWQEDDTETVFITVKTNHGTTISCGDEYLEAVQQILYSQ